MHYAWSQICHVLFQQSTTSTNNIQNLDISLQVLTVPYVIIIELDTLVRDAKPALDVRSPIDGLLDHP